jgi:rhamnose utilization protein RhaD (predicted bifunctional aldolase and dehydrogenase)
MTALDELAAVSARIGADPLLVQGPGGNSSVKTGDELWVKASGVWLAQALVRPIFTGLSLSAVHAAVARGEVEDFSAARLPGSDAALRPSIETALHALLPHAAVLHAHAVNAMAVSVLADGAARAAKALDGHVRWAWVPYRRPGAPLASAIAQVLAKTPADVLLLANHGIVVGADTPHAAEALLRDVEARLALLVATLSEAPAGAGDSDHERHAAADGLALDARLTAIFAAAPLFPDQVVFVGGAVPVLQPGETLAACAARIHAATGVLPALILAPGVGAYARRDRTPSADAVIAGLVEVARRLPANATVTGLPDGAAGALLNWDAEAWRLQQARVR